MEIMDNRGYVKQGLVEHMGVLMTQVAVSAESKFQSLIHCVEVVPPFAPRPDRCRQTQGSG